MKPLCSVILHNSVFDYTFAGFVSLDGYHNIITKLRPQNKNGGGKIKTGVGSLCIGISEKYDYKINEKICDLKLTNVEAVAANIKINNTFFSRGRRDGNGYHKDGFGRQTLKLCPSILKHTPC